MAETEDKQAEGAATFASRAAAIAALIGAAPLDSRLQEKLNADCPPGSACFDELAALIATGACEGWLCQREAGGIRYGRAIKPGGAAGRFSVDVVLMDTVAGPHHVHPQGEIGMVAPVSGEPRFDGLAAGWYVYAPGSDHRPTVAGGAAYVLYLLPDGAIEFTGK